jgi:hypothetical protein
MEEGNEVADMMEVQGPSDRSISFRVDGEPPTHRTGWRMVSTTATTAGNNGWNNCLITHDLTTYEKHEYREMVHSAMSQHGINRYPYFTQGETITLNVNLVLPRPESDFTIVDGAAVLTVSAFRYPMETETDCMLKFVLDSLKGLMYEDVRNIIRYDVRKLYPEDPLSKGWTEVHLSTKTLTGQVLI